MSTETPKQSKQPPRDHHWADETATRIIRSRKKPEGVDILYTLASGITPSGVVHVGNFREVMTVDLVKRALERKGKKVRFLFSWDDYDVFRKVPVNMPNPDELKGYLGKPITKVPDPFGKESSYARHHQVMFENSLTKVGLAPEFIYQAKKYQAADYVEDMIEALKKRKEIAVILNTHRNTPLGEDWYPISIFCARCDHNETTIIEAEGSMVSYRCERIECSHNETVDIHTATNVKLPWRIDWPMRWRYEQVDFEPGGKDHSSEGGSFSTGKEISEQIFEYEPPIYIPYDFISIKGRSGKMSSSKGEVITLEDLLEIYTPEIVRWIFASYKNNVEFAIAFDLDVIKNYEQYDRLERIYYGVEESSAKTIDKQKRIYELSQIVQEKKIRSTVPFQAAFRHLTNFIQIHEFDINRVQAEYETKFKDSDDEAKFIARFNCASRWIKLYAPEDFVFKLNTVKSHDFLAEYPAKYQKAVEKLSNSIKNQVFNLAEDKISEVIYDLIREFELDTKIFFEIIYRMLIGKTKGPRLAHFLTIIEREKLLNLL